MLESFLSIFISSFWMVKLVLILAAFLYFLPLETTTRMQLFFFVRFLFLLYFVRILSEMIKVFFRKKILTRSSLSGMQKSLFPFFQKILIASLWIWVFLFLLSSLGYNISGLLAWAGIAGIAVGLAAQKSIANIFGAVTILLNKPFGIGDYVNIAGNEWVVKDIWLSYLTLMDKAGHQVMIPNENIITTPIANFSVRENRRVDFTIGVVYSTPLEKVKQGVEALKTILQSYEKTEKISGDIRVNFEMFNAYSLDINATYFSLVWPLSEFIELKQEINLAIKAEFEKLGIEMAFPTQEMIVKNEAVEEKKKN